MKEQQKIMRLKKIFENKVSLQSNIKTIFKRLKPNNKKLLGSKKSLKTFPKNMNGSYFKPPHLFSSIGTNT